MKRLANLMLRIDRRVRDIGLCALVLTLLAYSWTFAAVSVPNERTRVYLTVSLVDHGTLRVDAPVARFGRVYDLARFDGHYYTDKAPGASLLAVPVYALARLFAPAAAFDIAGLCNLFRTWLMLPFGLAGFVLLRSLLRALRVSEPSVDLTSLCFALGTSMFHYSSAFYGHAIVCVMVLAVLRCFARAGLFKAPAAVDAAAPAHAPPAGGRSLWVLAAGACAGVAGLTEYQAVVLCVLLALPLLLAGSEGRARLVLAYLAGAAPFAALLLAYNARAFGGPLAFGYEHLVGSSLQALHGHGLAGATHPTLRSLAGLLWSAHRGLWTTSPLIGSGLFALPFLRGRMPRALWWTCAALCVCFILLVASSSVWFGGWSFGPRLLVPILGPLALATGFLLDAIAHRPVLQVAARAAGMLSVLYHQLAQASFAELPPELARPLPDALLPLLEHGVVAPNLACKLGGLGAWNLVPLSLLVALVLALLAMRAARWPLALSAALGAALWLGALGAAAPSVSAHDRRAFLQLVRRWQRVETCAGTLTSGGTGSARAALACRAPPRRTQ